VKFGQIHQIKHLKILEIENFNSREGAKIADGWIYVMETSVLVPLQSMEIYGQKTLPAI